MVYTGEGKGKSTAAFGLALRAFGRGLPVRIFQFIKHGRARFGEHRALARLGVPVEGLGDGFTWKSRDLEASARLAQEGWERAKEAILSGAYHLAPSRTPPSPRPRPFSWEAATRSFMPGSLRKTGGYGRPSAFFLAPWWPSAGGICTFPRGFG